MKSNAKKFLALFLCICMLMSGTAYAQESGNAQADNQTPPTLEEQGTEPSVEGEKTESTEPGEAETVDGVETNEDNLEEQESKLSIVGMQTEGTAQSDAVAADGVEINEKNFPDANFREYVSDEFDRDGDGKLSENEIDAVMTIDVSCRNIVDLTGIEYFVSLEELNCQGDISCMTLTSLDVSKNVNLKKLYCDCNNLETLDVSKNVNLIHLSCGVNWRLKTLDVSQNVNLESLVCGDNSQLGRLDVSRNVNLTHLVCPHMGLKTLDVSNNTKLKELRCNANELTVLDVSKNTNLMELDCEANQLKSLNVSRNVGLTRLVCGHNTLGKLDVRNCTRLDCLDVRPLPKATVKYKNRPATFLYGSDNPGHWNPYIDIFTKTDPAKIKPETSRIDLESIYKIFGIGDATDMEVIVEQKEAGFSHQKRLTDHAAKFGDKVLKIYDVVMNLYKDGRYNTAITDNFGKLTLSFYAEKEYAGKTVVVYQLHGTSEVIPYRDLTVDENGMVTITVSKLSTFAVALQGSGANASPQTGDSANMTVWIVLAILAMSAIPITARRRQKR